MTIAPIPVTGANQRISLRCVRRLLTDGESVVVSYRSKCSALGELCQIGALALHADFASKTDIFTFIRSLRQHTDNLRAIVHNTSDWVAKTPGHEAKAFQQLSNVHMFASYPISLYCVELLERSQPADIVHLADDVACKGSVWRIAHYASRVGLDNLTLSFAVRFALRIKTNATSSALVMLSDGDSAGYHTHTLAKSILGIEPRSEVIYQSLHYLLNNPYVTGTTLIANSGRHVKRGARDLS